MLTAAKIIAIKPKIFDIVFIDGAHDKDSVRRDILNSLDHLRKGGIVVCHDVCPLEKRLLDPDACHNAWEAFAELRSERTDLLFYSIPVNHCGFILLNDGSKKHSDYNTMCLRTSRIPFLIYPVKTYLIDGNF